MKSSSGSHKLSTVELPDVVRNTAIVIASVSIALATISLTIVSIIDSLVQAQDQGLYYIRLALFVMGLVLIFSAALTIDWLIDRFTQDDWDKALDKPNYQILKFDQIPARLGLFNGGYLAFSLGIAGICFGNVFQALIRLDPNFGMPLSFIIAIATAFWLLFQMMTFTLARSTVTLLVIGFIIGLAVSGAL